MKKTITIGLCMFLLIISLALAQSIEYWEGLEFVSGCDSGSGNYCAKVNPETTASQTLPFDIVPETYIVSLKAKSDSTSSLTITLGLVSHTININNDWQRYEVSFDIQTSTNIFQLSTDVPVKVDAIKLEQGSAFTSYDPEEFPQGCCPQTYCWSGKQCVEGVLSFGLANEASLSGTFGFDRIGWDMFGCINGTWNKTYYKEQWFNQTRGYCLDDTQCWANEDIGCVEDAGYVNDFLCFAKDGVGEWSSRSKIIATTMLKYAEDNNLVDYSIYCDTYNNSLNYFLYPVSGKNAVEFIGACNIEQITGGLDDMSPTGDITYSCNEMYMNNFCVMHYKDAAGHNLTALGVSLNKNISEDNGFLTFMGESESYCDGITKDGAFHVCSGNDEFWYNSKINSVIYAKEGIEISVVSFWESFFHNPFTAIIDYIVDALKPTYRELEESELSEIPLNFTKNVKVFNRLFIDVKGDKQIHGVVEKLNIEQKFLSIEYINIPNICQATEDYNAIHQGQFTFGGLSCTEEGNKAYVISRDNFVTNYFPDLSAKLRVK